MGWLIAGGVALVLVATGVAFSLRREQQRPTEGSEERARADEPDPFFILGIVFFGAGIALFVTIGPAMLFMPALGIIYMALGIARTRKRSR